MRIPAENKFAKKGFIQGEIFAIFIYIAITRTVSLLRGLLSDLMILCTWNDF